MIEIIEERSLLLNNLIIRGSFKYFFITVIEINKRYRLMKDLQAIVRFSGFTK